jgi:hypothetical protein
MAHVMGAVVAAVLVSLAAAALIWCWRRPFVGLGLLVAGLAFHNFAIMVLLRLGTPNTIVHAIQGWKEAILLLLCVVALSRLWHQRRQNQLGPAIASDWIAVAFAIVCVVYFAIPPSVLSSDATVSQRLVGLRTLALIPLLYFLGRTVMAASDRDRLMVVYLGLGAAAAVTLFGLFEVFVVPTRTWLDWGVNQYSNFLGFTYQGPAGLPENFFITVGNGALVRRMVSTYVSPLGIAYTALILFPLAIGAMDGRVSQKAARWIAVATALLILGVALSITRLALFALVGEALVLTILLRRAWIAALVPLLAVAGVVAFLPFASITPAVDKNLDSGQLTGKTWNLPATDSSAKEHKYYFMGDLKLDLAHPLGLGTGASTIRFGKQELATGESAVLGIFGDLGVAGGLLYLALYGLAIWQGWRALRLSRPASPEDLLPLVALVGGLALIPISLTSDVWGDLSVTLPFWWSAGAAATLCAQGARRQRRASREARAARWKVSAG